MGCLTVTYTRLGGMTASAERVGGISCSASRVGGMDATATRIGGMDASIERVGGMTCRFSLICTTGIMPPYLEINPRIVWIYENPVDNDVYSNTRWRVD